MKHWPALLQIIYGIFVLVTRISYSKTVVLNPGPGEPQGVLPFVLTEQLIDQ